LLVVFDSKTGNVQRFINKLGIKSVKIHNEMLVNEPFSLITYTTGMGQVPKSTLEFLKQNYQNMTSVTSSGNKNWGNNFGLAADKISQLYNVPILMKFELSGTNADVQKFLQEVKKIEDS
jgi:protein involved in ribonucleotide reduction